MPEIKIKNKYLPLLTCTAAASFMVNLDTYIVNVAIPAVAADFFVSKADISWVIIAYNLMVVSLLLFFGKLADKIGVARLFICGFIIFTTASLFCALSQNLPQMVISRIIQGIGASILYALPQAMISKYLPPKKRAVGFSFNASAAALGIMLGAPVSGLLTGLFSWHMIFLINLPIGIFVILTLLLTFKNTPERNDSDMPFDSKGAALSFFAVLTLTFYLNRINSLGITNIFMQILFISSVILFIIFIRHCFKTDNPVLDLKLFQNRDFTYANIAMFFISALLAGNNFLMPFYLSEIKHLDEISIGFLFMIYSASYLLFSIIYGKTPKINNSKYVSIIACLVSMVSLLFFIIALNKSGIVYTAIFFALMGFAFSFFIISNNNFVMSLAKKKSEGAVAGLHRTTGRFGMLFGVVIFELIFSLSGNINNLKGYIVSYIFAIIICAISAFTSYKAVFTSNFDNKELSN